MVAVRSFHVLLILGGMGTAILTLGCVLLVYARSRGSQLPVADDIQLLTDLPESSVSVKKIVVDVEGAVNRPGLQSIATVSARLSDAIVSAGGFSSRADLEFVARQLNLAEPLRDSMKIYIPSRGEKPIVSDAAGGTESIVNVNTAPLSVLQTLKGIGSVRAQAIIDHRPYKDANELQLKAKLGKATIDGITPLISF